jgi:hypothetical protein
MVIFRAINLKNAFILPRQKTEKNNLRLVQPWFDAHEDIDGYSLAASSRGTLLANMVFWYPGVLKQTGAANCGGEP